jgi:hypothetical protein
LRIKFVSGGRHPNLAAANDWDMGGQAQKARNLLEQANVELKEAAMAANRNRR